MIVVEFTGTLAHIMSHEIENRQDGSKRTKYELVLTNTSDNYIDTLCVQVWAEKLNQSAPDVLQEGVAYKVRGALNTREWQGKYYTQVNLLNITPVEVEASAPSPQQSPNVQKSKAEQKAAPAPAPMEPQQPKDDLPF